jgi:hypothetical protein
MHDSAGESHEFEAKDVDLIPKDAARSPCVPNEEGVVGFGFFLPPRTSAQTLTGQDIPVAWIQGVPFWYVGGRFSIKGSQ